MRKSVSSEALSLLEEDKNKEMRKMLIFYTNSLKKQNIMIVNSTHDIANNQNLKLQQLFYMKPSIKKNLSFVSNQQLIENLKNRPSKNLSRNRSVQTNISLLEKKNYDGEFASLSNAIQKSHNTSLRQSLSNTHSKIDGQSQNKTPNIMQSAVDTKNESKSLVKFLRENITNKKLLNQVESLVHKIEATSSNTQNRNYEDLLQKNSQLYAEKLSLKKQKKKLQNKIKQITEQYENKNQMLRKQNERLHKLVLKQSQMITNQVCNEDDSSEDFRKMLLTQAKVIEALRNGNGKVGWRAMGSR